jgi:catechol 2,3-dioxygenase-like lactoylglutathione lyase family enzyme
LDRIAEASIATGVGEAVAEVRERLELHHTAYVVADLDSALTAWQETLDASLEAGPFRVQADGVRVCFLRYPGGRVELVERQGALPSGRPDHVCFLCDDLDARVGAARDQGGVVVRAPAGSEAFGGRRMCFVLYRDVGLIEWVER